MSITALFQGTSGKILLNDKEIGELQYIDLQVIPVYADLYIGATPCKKAVSIQYIGNIKFKTENLIFEEFIKDKNVQFTIECNFADAKKAKYTLYGVTFDKLFIEDVQKGNLTEKTYKYTALDIISEREVE